MWHSSGVLKIEQQHTDLDVHRLQFSRYTDDGTAVYAYVPGFLMIYWPDLKQQSKGKVKKKIGENSPRGGGVQRRVIFH